MNIQNRVGEADQIRDLIWKEKTEIEEEKRLAE